jgi:hypothetical protein
MYVCMWVSVRESVFVGSFVFYDNKQHNISMSSSYSKTVLRNWYCFSFLCFIYFQLFFFFLSFVYLLFQSTWYTCVCFVWLKINFTVITVLLWPSVFYLALVVVVTTKTQKKINEKKKYCRDYRI